MLINPIFANLLIVNFVVNSAAGIRCYGTAGIWLHLKKLPLVSKGQSEGCRSTASAVKKLIFYIALFYQNHFTGFFIALRYQAVKIYAARQCAAVKINIINSRFKLSVNRRAYFFAGNIKNPQQYIT